MGITDFFRGSVDARMGRRVVAGMRAQGETRRLQFAEDQMLLLALDDTGERACTWSLHNLRHELSRCPEPEHDEIYRRYLAGMNVNSIERPTDYATAKPLLRVLLKDRSYPQFIELMHRVEHPDGKTSPNVVRPIGADVLACVVLNFDNGLTFVTENDALKWGVSPAQVLDDAMENIDELPFDTDVSQGVHYVLAQDSYISARMLCQQPIRELRVKGLPVAALPDRDSLFIAGSEDEQGLTLLANVIGNQLEKASRHISGRPLVLTENGWEEFSPPESLRVTFANLARQFDAMYWNEIQTFMQQDLANRGESIRVGRMEVLEGDDEESFTSCAWLRDEELIVPVVERICFHDSDDDALRSAAWADVMRVMGPSMKLQPGSPTHYRVQAFPDAKQFLAMGAQSHGKAGDESTG